MRFGDYFRQLRIRNRMTLRGYCERFGQEPSNISKLENNKLNPSKDEEKLKSYAISLELKENTQEWVTFFDLAYQANQELPKEVKEKVPQIITLLPAFLRTGSNKQINKEKVKELIEFLEKGGE
jgi:transcriptional regulator with XRE-family HTH domain